MDTATVTERKKMAKQTFSIISYHNQEQKYYQKKNFKMIDVDGAAFYDEVKEIT